MEAREFLNSPQCKKHLAPLLARFQKIVDANPDDGEVRPKPLKKTVISEFKKDQVRIFCFRDEDAWVLTHGDLKKTNQTPQNNITRAETIRKEDLELAKKRKMRKGGHATHDG
jgi:phage-related protein